MILSKTFEINKYGYTKGDVWIEPEYKPGDTIPNDSKIYFKSLDKIKWCDTFLNFGSSNGRLEAKRQDEHTFYIVNQEFRNGYAEALEYININLEYDPNKPVSTTFNCSPDFSMTTNTEQYTVTPKLEPNFSTSLPLTVTVELDNKNATFINPKICVATDSYFEFKDLEVNNSTASISFDDSETITCHQLNFDIVEPKHLTTPITYILASEGVPVTLTPNLKGGQEYDLPLNLELTSTKKIESCVANCTINNQSITKTFTLSYDKKSAILQLSDDSNITINSINVFHSVEKFNLKVSSQFKVDSNTTEYQLDPDFSRLNYELPIHSYIRTQDNIKSATFTYADSSGNVHDAPYTIGIPDDTEDTHIANLYLGFKEDVTLLSISITVEEIVEPPKVANVYDANPKVISALNDAVKNKKEVSNYTVKRYFGKIKLSKDEKEIFINDVDLNVKSKTAPSTYKMEYILNPQLTYDSYTDLEPYTRLKLEVPFVGVVELQNQTPITELSVQYNIDIISSTSNCIIKTNAETQILPCKPYQTLNYVNHTSSLDSALYNTLSTSNFDFNLQIIKKKIISKSDLIPINESNFKLSNIINKPNIKFKGSDLNLNNSTLSSNEFSRLNSLIRLGLITKEEK